MFLIEILLWMIIPAINFFVCYQFGYQSIKINSNCPPSSPSSSSSSSLESNSYNLHNNNNLHNNHLDNLNNQIKIKHEISFESMDSSIFQRHREVRIVKLNYRHDTLILNFHPSTPCNYIANNLVEEAPGSCFGIIYDNSPLIDNSQPLLRYENESNKPLHFSGFFSKPGNLKGRKRFIDKLSPLLNSLKEVEREMDQLLLERNIPKGGDVVVMVVNAGEMDLFMNFACSCRLHNISLNNVLVFAASSDIIPLIFSTGALGYYHHDFATASREHSIAYLDGIFVDMMWYKSFSVWLLLHLGRNVLFQDVDIIWLRDPFTYFHETIESIKLRSTSSSDPDQINLIPDAFLSDDGQRASPRFSPFYANSGFYYLLSNPKTIVLSWYIMISFDVIQSNGSHQNTFTQRLLEIFNLFNIITVNLSQYLFPNGAVYHHTPSFIKKMMKRIVVPYMFHMCWTANKLQKLQYFNVSNMWYLTDNLNVHDLIMDSRKMVLKNNVRENVNKNGVSYWENIWDDLGSKICNAREDSP